MSRSAVGNIGTSGNVRVYSAEYLEKRRMKAIIDREDWKNRLARIIAKARHGPGVDMGGKHNPRPSEILAANRFVDDLLDAIEKSSERVNEDRNSTP